MTLCLLLSLCLLQDSLHDPKQPGPTLCRVAESLEAVPAP